MYGYGEELILSRWENQNFLTITVVWNQCELLDHRERATSEPLWRPGARDGSTGQSGPIESHRVLVEMAWEFLIFCNFSACLTPPVFLPISNGSLFSRSSCKAKLATFSPLPLWHASTVRSSYVQIWGIERSKAWESWPALNKQWKLFWSQRGSLQSRPLQRAKCTRI